ncbi:MAG: class II fumarate hydratase [Phycisphaerales bacterium]|nr:class II fumarate hydratase [Phycisphaerales bacterium]
MTMRIERDSLGELEVPMDAYYGVQTQRAVSNFPISGQPMPREFIVAMAIIKKAAAVVNRELRLLDGRLADAIAQACKEIIDGAEWAWGGGESKAPRGSVVVEHRSMNQFPVDVYQTGSGTSTNMNVNEVVASRANEILGGKRGDKSPVHPNDHVNMGQSSNDVIPTALQVMTAVLIQDQLWPAIGQLRDSLQAQSEKLWSVIKTGRTHLQDATPIRLGQEFSGFVDQMKRSTYRASVALEEVQMVPLGGTAVGTGINTHKEFASRVCREITKDARVEVAGFEDITYEIREAENHFWPQATLDAAVATHGELKGIAVSLTKIVNDIRWMGSGPRAGLGEIELPAVQPGSSIMPGKVNPVICESVLMVCQRVIGNDAAMTAAGSGNNFELAMSMPLAAVLLHESITLLAAACGNLATQCIDGIKPTTRGPELVEKGLMLATALAPVIGYEKAAEIAKEAAKTGRTIREVAREKTSLSEDELTKLLDPTAMVDAK